MNAPAVEWRVKRCTRDELPDIAVNVSIGTAVRRIREARGVTQAALARAIGVSRTCVAHREAGRARWPVPDLVRVGHALGVALAEFDR